MDFFLERALTAFLVVFCPLLSIFDLPGNSLLLLSAFGFAFWNEGAYFNGRLLSAMVLVYVLGECWEFVVGLFGIKKEKVSWLAVVLIGGGGFAGTIMGTMAVPILGSVVGGIAGAAATAFVYEFIRTGMQADAAHLAWAAAKMKFLAVIGKIAAGITLAVLLVKLVYF